MYDCFRGILEEKSHSSKTLQDFFANIHEKVTQNVDEKHLLSVQGSELKASLAKSKEQIAHLDKLLQEAT